MAAAAPAPLTADLEHGLRRLGHPGRVWELHLGHHVLVHWAGLEDTDESQVVGFSTDDSGQIYRGLAAITGAEYLRRVERLATGW
jgi:hypothetical protein